MKRDSAEGQPNIVVFISVATLLIIFSIIVFETTPPRNSTAGVICNNCSYEVSEKPTYTDKLFEPVSIFTLLLFVSTGLLWGATKSLVESAKKSADTVQILERGYLFLNDPIAGNIADALIYPTHFPMSLYMWVTFKNHGRTPVTIRGLDQVYAYFKDLDNVYTCPIPGQILPNGIVVGANRVSPRFKCKLGFSATEAMSAMNNNGYIVYHVVVDYIDIFGKKCSTSACRVYHGGGDFYVWGDERLNYNKN